MNTKVTITNDPLERDRQSGRTTRMMAEAIAAALTGKKVVVLMKDMAAVDHWTEKLNQQQWAADINSHSYISIEPMCHPVSPEIDWDKMTLIGERSNHLLLIDHDVIYGQFKHVLRAWTKYVLKPTDANA